jgi:hypothetical protein
MARYNKYGFAYDQIIAEDYALPANTTPVVLTNVVTLDNTKGNARIIVCASDTTVELGSSAVLEFRPYVGATAAACTTVLPGTIITEGKQTDASWDSGEVICEIAVPKLLLGTNKYLALYAYVSANENADHIEAYLVYD